MGTVVIIRMQGEPEVAEASVTLYQPEACLVLSLDHGPLAVTCCTGSWGGVDSDLCLNTGFSVAAAAALVVHAHVWGPS